MSDENLVETPVVETVVESAVDVASVPEKIEKTLEEKFASLVKILADHGIHVG